MSFTKRQYVGVWEKKKVLNMLQITCPRSSLMWMVTRSHHACFFFRILAGYGYFGVNKHSFQLWKGTLGSYKRKIKQIKDLIRDPTACKAQDTISALPKEAENPYISLQFPDTHNCNFFFSRQHSRNRRLFFWLIFIFYKWNFICLNQKISECFRYNQLKYRWSIRIYIIHKNPA